MFIIIWLAFFVNVVCYGNAFDLRKSYTNYVEINAKVDEDAVLEVVRFLFIVNLIVVYRRRGTFKYMYACFRICVHMYIHIRRIPFMIKIYCIFESYFDYLSVC